MTEELLVRGIGLLDRIKRLRNHIKHLEDEYSKSVSRKDIVRVCFRDNGTQFSSVNNESFKELIYNILLNDAKDQLKELENKLEKL